MNTNTKHTFELKTENGHTYEIQYECTSFIFNLSSTFEKQENGCFQQNW